MGGADPLPDVGDEPAMPGQKQVSVGLVFVTTDAPAELVEIAEAETAVPQWRIAVDEVFA